MLFNSVIPLDLGANLAQINPQKMKKRNTVYFISRLLTQIEKNILLLLYYI